MGTPVPARRPPKLPLPPTWNSCVISGRPPRTTHVLAVVPPMSNEIASANPAPAAASTPAAGPDSIVATARLAARSAEITPPLDSITCTGARIPISASRSRSRER